MSYPSLKKQFIYIISCCLLLAASCGDKKSNTKNADNIVTDTTALGKEIALVSKKIGDSPDNADLYHERAKLHMKRNDIANAMLDMMKVTDLDSTKPAYFITLADVHFASGKPGKAKSALEKCLELDPKNISAYDKLAELYFYAAQYDKALLNLDEVIKLDINNSKAYFMRGMCYRDMGDTAKAVSSFQTAIEQKADYYDAYLQLGMIFHARNNKIALQYYDGALRINPKSTDAFYDRGLFYQEVLHDFDNAIQDYTSAIQVDPKAVKAHFALGYVHFEYLKVYDQAIKHYTDALNIEPNYAEAIYNRGLCYEAVGNIGAAKQDYQKAIQIRQDYELAKNALARVSK